jgi:hypothetical protein
LRKVFAAQVPELPPANPLRAASLHKSGCNPIEYRGSSYELRSKNQNTKRNLTTGLPHRMLPAPHQLFGAGDVYFKDS